MRIFDDYYYYYPFSISLPFWPPAGGASPLPGRGGVSRKARAAPSLRCHLRPYRGPIHPNLLKKRLHELQVPAVIHPQAFLCGRWVGDTGAPIEGGIKLIGGSRGISCFLSLLVWLSFILIIIIYYIVFFYKYIIYIYFIILYL